MNVRFNSSAVRIRLSEKELDALASGGGLQERFPIGKNASFLLTLNSAGVFDLCWAWPGLIVDIPEQKVKALKQGSQADSKVSCEVHGEFQGTRISLELDYFQKKGLR